MSWFAREGAHRNTTKKIVGGFAFKEIVKTMVARMVALTVSHAANMDCFRACVLGTTSELHLRRYGDLTQAYFRRLGAAASSSAQTPVGAVHAWGPHWVTLSQWGRCSRLVIVVLRLRRCGCVCGRTSDPRMGAPDIGHRPLAQMLWCQQIHRLKFWFIITRGILPTSASP